MQCQFLLVVFLSVHSLGLGYEIPSSSFSSSWSMSIHTLHPVYTRQINSELQSQSQPQSFFHSFLRFGFTRPRPAFQSHVILAASSSTTATSFSSTASSLPLSSNVSSSNSSLDFFNALQKRFQGDFDNYHQFIQNQQNGLSPGAGGGHEHIHATILPLSMDTCLKITQMEQDLFDPIPSLLDETMIPYQNMYGQELSSLPSQDMPPCSFVLAAYYLDGTPSKIFRFRLYSLEPTTVGTTVQAQTQNTSLSKSIHSFENNLNVLLKIYSVDQKIMSNIREHANQPSQWDHIIREFITRYKSSMSPMDSSQSDYDETAPNPLFRLIKGCNVLWTPTCNPIRHSYLTDSYFEDSSDDDDDDEKNCIPKDGSFHAIMLNETGAIVDSMISPGKTIRIQDELSLWGAPSDALWINDRGFDTETGHFIYGNRVGVPYKMDRVASWFENSSEKQSMESGVNDNESGMPVKKRIIVNEGPGKELLWTLGGSEEEA